MKTEIVKSKKVSRLPEVGEAWRHEGSDNVLIRIPDEDGYNALSRHSRALFYSCELRTGRIMRTVDGYGGIIILEPVGGVMRFQEKGAV